jgi:tetratricopeptide (TPR) repeat protein
MTFCHQCGFQLTLGTERFCPDCGIDLRQKAAVVGGEDDNTNHLIKINDTKRDVFGIGGSGFGNITGKEIAYNIQGNVIYLINPSKEAIEGLKNIIEVPTKLNTNLDYKNTAEVKETHTGLISTKQQVSQVLGEVRRINDEKSRDIQEIKAGDVKTSKNELLLKELLLRGNENYYLEKYEEAIRSYDKAIEIDSNNFEVWFNKGYSLGKLSRYGEALLCLDNAAEINPNDADTWNNKGWSLHHLGGYEEAIECLDKAIEIDHSLRSHGIAKDILFMN